MKKNTLKLLSFPLLLSLALFTAILPTPWTHSEAAATWQPQFQAESIILTGIGATQTLQITNTVNSEDYAWYFNESGSIVYKITLPSDLKSTTYYWYSSKKSVVTVSQKGLVTAVKKGTAQIHCKITYPDKKVIDISCEVIVKVPATSVTIYNANLENGVHTLRIGTTFDFNASTTPASISDKKFYSIRDTSIATVDELGVVTPLKPGITLLTIATADTAEAVATSPVRDTVILQVIPGTIEVKAIQLNESHTIQIHFNNPIDPASVMDVTTGILKDSVTVTPVMVYGITANSTGTLRGVVTNNSQTLVITTENALYGYYDIRLNTSVTSSIDTKVMPLVFHLERVVYGY